MMEAVCQSTLNPSSDINYVNLDVSEKENQNELVVEERDVPTHSSLVIDLAKTAPSILTEPIAKNGLTLDVEVDQETQPPMPQVN